MRNFSIVCRTASICCLFSFLFAVPSSLSHWLHKCNNLYMLGVRTCSSSSSACGWVYNGVNVQRVNRYHDTLGQIANFLLYRFFWLYSSCLQRMQTLRKFELTSCIARLHTHTQPHDINNNKKPRGWRVFSSFAVFFFYYPLIRCPFSMFWGNLFHIWRHKLNY